MKKLLLLVFSLCLLSCGTTKQLSTSVAADYGYSQEKPILVGGDDLKKGPLYERDYLLRLTGPNGEEVFFKRAGSCCGFDTDNGFLGGGMLDRYELTYEGLREPVILYLNMYDPNPAEPVAPKGFKLKE